MQKENGIPDDKRVPFIKNYSECNKSIILRQFCSSFNREDDEEESVEDVHYDEHDFDAENEEQLLVFRDTLPFSMLSFPV